MKEKAPDPQKKKELKTFIFTRNIQNEEKTPKEPKESKENIPKPEKDEIKDKIILTFNLFLYEDEIVFNVEQKKENFKVANIIYEKGFLSEYFKNCQFLSKANLEKIFDLIQKSFELYYDHISLEEKELKIKLMINIMDILTEEINFEIPMIKMTNQDEVLLLKESLKFLEQERNNQKKEIKTLNDSLKELQKKDKTQENMILELKNIIEANKMEFQKKLEDNMAEFQKKLDEKENSLQKKIDEKENMLQNKIEDNKAEFQTKIEEKENILQNKINEKNNLCNNKIKEIKEQTEKRDNEIFTSVKKHQEEIKGLQMTEKYVKEKLICEGKEKEKEEKGQTYKRTLNNFSMEIDMILYKDKIKIGIKEIQDNLNNNPTLYESNFNIEDLSKKNVHFKNLEKIENIFAFLNGLYHGKKDTIKKEKDKIIISVKFPLGNNECEVSFDILEKNISLETTLKNLSSSLKEINKNNITTIAEFKKDLLEKVYPIGS